MSQDRDIEAIVEQVEDADAGIRTGFDRFIASVQTWLTGMGAHE